MYGKWYAIADRIPGLAKRLGRLVDAPARNRARLPGAEGEGALVEGEIMRNWL